MAKYPLPPFDPAGPIIVKSKWDDEGEWDDDKVMFPGTVTPEIETYLATQTGAALETQDGKTITI